MNTAKFSISLDKALLKKIDTLITKRVFENRSQAIQEALREKINRIEKLRLAHECSKLNKQEEQEWLKY